MRNRQISRIYTLLDLLDGAPHGLTVNELTDRIVQRGHEASRRTVYRDLQALNKAGFPLFERDIADDKSVRWSMDKTTRINQHFLLSLKELIALYLSKSFLNPLSEMAFHKHLQSAFSKIEEKLGPIKRDFIDSLSNEIFIDSLPQWGVGSNPDVIETIRLACSESHCLSITYSRNHQSTPEERLVGPHCLYFAKGSLYLLCEDLKDKSMKTFAVPRLSKAEMLPDEYLDKKVDPTEYFRNSFGMFHGRDPIKIKLKFSEIIAPYIKERRWHQSQRIDSNSDGSITMYLKVSVTPDLIQWLLGFGVDLKIIEPLDLREKIKDQAQAILELYSESAA